MAMVEMQRSNVTVAQFLRHIQTACAKQGLSRGFDRDDFEHPHIERSDSYRVIDGEKRTHSEYYQTTTHWGRKLFATELYSYEVTERAHHNGVYPADDAPCKAETLRTFAYDFQTYVLGWDGSCYNEICEFTFDDDKRGHGYYYQVCVDAE